jgi:tRNA (guanine-N7-)-methyltransferase
MSNETKERTVQAGQEENAPIDGSSSSVAVESESNTKENISGKKRKNNNSRIAPITTEGDMPQKKFYRQRAHCNPLSHNDNFSYPLQPGEMDWTEEHYPGWEKYKPSGTTADAVVPTVLDIGCGFGGLTVALSTILPNETILGMEIRAKVTEFVRLRILALRKEVPGSYENASVMRTNSMKFLPNYFRKGCLNKLFFCFPDPHFKRKNHPRRIVSERLLTEYAHFLAPGGKLYCITDVKELHDWHVAKCDTHPLFDRIEDEEELAKDPCVNAMITETEEGKKVARNKGSKYYAVYRYRYDLVQEGKNDWHMGNFFDPVTEEEKTEKEN